MYCYMLYHLIFKTSIVKYADDISILALRNVECLGMQNSYAFISLYQLLLTAK